MWRVNNALNDAWKTKKLAIDADKFEACIARYQSEYEASLQKLYDMAYISVPEFNKKTWEEVLDTLVRSEYRKYFTNNWGKLDTSAFRIECVRNMAYLDKEFFEFATAVLELLNSNEKLKTLREIKSNTTKNLAVQNIKFNQINLLQVNQYPYTDVWIEILKGVSRRAVRHLDFAEIFKSIVEPNLEYTGSRELINGYYSKALEPRLFVSALSGEASPLNTPYLTYLIELNQKFMQDRILPYRASGSSLLRDLWSTYRETVDKIIDNSLASPDIKPIAIGNNQIFFVKER